MDSWDAYINLYIYTYQSFKLAVENDQPQPNGTPVFLVMPCGFFCGSGFYYSRIFKDSFLTSKGVLQTVSDSPRSVRQERIGHFIFIEIHSHDHRRGRRGNHAWGVKNATRTFLWGSTFWVVFFEMPSIFEDNRFASGTLVREMFT